MNLFTVVRSLVVAAALAAAPLAAGVVFQVETTYHSGSPGVESSEMSVEKPNLKMEISPGREGGSEGGSGEAIYNGDKRQMVVVDHDEQSYMVIDAATVEQIGGAVAGQMEQAMKELEKQMEGMDPKQREMMEEMLKGRMPGGAMGAAPSRPVVEYRDTGERATREGYPCVRYDGYRDGEKFQELWVTDWDNVEGGREVADTFLDMASFYDELLDSFESVMGGAGGFFGDRNPIESWTSVDGFPVVTRSFEGGELESETVLKSATERDLDPDAFEPPKGYRLRTMGPQ